MSLAVRQLTVEIVDNAEQIAKQVVESTIEGAQMWFRKDQSAGCHDFDLHLPSGELAAVEVTTSADERLLGTAAAILKPRKGDSFVPAKKSRMDWLVHPLPHARINKIRSMVDDYLSQVEAARLQHFFGPTDSSGHPAVDRIYRDLAIEGGTVLRWKKPGQICIALPGGGGKVTSRHVLEAVETEAFKPDNKRKLANANSRERHLFVYVHPRNYLAWVSLVDKHPPPESPKLPKEITHVWVASETRDPGHFAVWRACGAVGWSESERL